VIYSGAEVTLLIISGWEKTTGTLSWVLALLDVRIHGAWLVADLHEEPTGYSLPSEVSRSAIKCAKAMSKQEPADPWNILPYRGKIA
jgi:hypothetical protein